MNNKEHSLEWWILGPSDTFAEQADANDFHRRIKRAFCIGVFISTIISILGVYA